MTSLLDPAERTARGLTIQAEVTGASQPPPDTLLEGTWRDFVFAEIWNRPGLERRARFLISLAGAASSNGPSELLDGYVRGALTSGLLTLVELREAALQLAIYGGFSRGVELDRAVSRVAAELGLSPVKLAPLRAEPWDAKQRVQQGIAEFGKVLRARPRSPPSSKPASTTSSLARCGADQGSTCAPAAGSPRLCLSRGRRRSAGRL
jgi:4-carboxymuconolactone decarboxylase